MARKTAAAAELRALPGQRSIPSMFADSRIGAGGSGNGRTIPLMEFLNRKSEKRGSLQGGVVDACLTPGVRERLDAIRKNDTGSSKQDERSDNIGQVSVGECTSSCDEEEFVSTEHWNGPPVRAKLGGSMLDKLCTARVLDGDGISSLAGVAGSEPRHTNPRISMDFIDLTEDNDYANGGVDGDICPQEERSEINSKRKRLQQEVAITEMCPVCNELFPREMLQAHVESELDRSEKFEIDPESEAQDSGTVQDGSVGAWGDEARFPERSMHFTEPGLHSRPRPRLLVLGDEPRHRRRANVRHNNNGPGSTFNHYADGGGWWDEGRVGVDAESVGSTSVWEGLGSMSFGGTL